MLRHQKVISGRPTPYGLWRTNLAEFDRFQSYQSPKDRSFFSRPNWASFVVTPSGETLFVGLYEVKLIGSAPSDVIDPVTGVAPGADKTKEPITPPYDLYSLIRSNALADYAGRIVIDWGKGHRSWRQVASKQDKQVIELRRGVIEPPFPGFLRFIGSLSEIASLPVAWQEALSSVRGIYLLTCPKTREQYVGMASSSGGFLQRWMEYVVTGHGGNLGLKLRDPSDYQVSILEVCGSSATLDDIAGCEGLWKRKLQSREMGLNKN
ncbi:MAG: GIY-YIG nuclease family protein [Novosphingobium sp.]|uniref:GIY-YIG nuclease family protein n=1 Tax=Novosphingobium sp. TaxID=1874826 RepID=UPI0027366B5E|nr:GIY-YIG nuclease family protein [Novosphingobium sp.]MDP3551567.1 GIY-YIG nuclease family protein [Novosphingobium sp.]